MKNVLNEVMKKLTRLAITNDVSPIYRMEDLAIDKTNLENWIASGHTKFIWLTRPHGTNLFSLKCFNADWEVTARGDHTKFQYYMVDTSSNEVKPLDADYALSLINQPARLPAHVRRNDFIDGVNDILTNSGLREDIVSKGFNYVLQYAKEHQIKSLRLFMERVFSAGLI